MIRDTQHLQQKGRDPERQLLSMVGRRGSLIPTAVDSLDCYTASSHALCSVDTSVLCGCIHLKLLSKRYGPFSPQPNNPSRLFLARRDRLRCAKGRFCALAYTTPHQHHHTYVSKSRRYSIRRQYLKPKQFSNNMMRLKHYCPKKSAHIGDARGELRALPQNLLAGHSTKKYEPEASTREKVLRYIRSTLGLLCSRLKT